MLIRTKRMLKKWLVRLGMVIALFLLCYVNVRRLNNNIYSNYERAVDYGRVRENKEIIEPIIAAVFYQGAEEEKKAVSTYFDRSDNYKRQNVKIVAVPYKMSENSLPIAEKLYEEISKHNDIKKIVLVANGKEGVGAHKKLLRKIMKVDDLQVLSTDEADVSVEDKIESYLRQEGNVTVVLADLNKISNGTNDDFLIGEVIWLAQKYAYNVNVFDALDTQIAKSADKGYEALFSPAISGEEPLLKKQQRNLQKYITQYKDLLLKYFKQNLLLGLEKETIWPAKSSQTYRLYDRGVVYARFFGEDGKELFARAKVGKNKGVIVSLVELARKAAHKISKPIKYYKIYLLTDFEPLEWQGDELTSYLEEDDGVYIQYKDRKALMVADERPQNPDDWLKFLYLRASVPENANKQDIKLFKFKTVEIENEN